MDSCTHRAIHECHSPASGSYAEGEAIARQQIEKSPLDGSLWKQLGLMIALQGRSAESLEAMQRSVALLPQDAEAQNNLGLTLKHLGRLTESEASYRRALAIRPDYADVYGNLGLTLSALGRLAEAESCLRRALELKPDYAEVQSNLGIILTELGRFDEAEASYRRALEIKPTYAKAHNNLGLTLKELGRMEEAEACYRRALEITPDYAEVLSNLGLVLADLGRLNEAEASYRRALEIKPDSPEVLTNLGLTLTDLCRLNEAESCHGRALELLPGYAEAQSNLGITLMALGRLDEAEFSYRRAMDIKPDYAEAHFNLSLLHLLKADFANGLPEYEWRWYKKGADRKLFVEAPWLGAETLNEKTVLLHSEQGLGDTIQFCRYVPLVAALGARVVLEVPGPLVELMKDLQGVTEIISKGTPLPSFDFHIPLLSLPLAFKTNGATIPGGQPYLHSDSGKVASWLDRLGDKTKQRVGIVWSGSSLHKNDRIRSIPLTDLINSLPECFEYVSLQKEVREADRATLHAHPNIRHFGEYLHDFSDTAALCELMDLIISVDTSVAHLCGAVGKPTWILLPFSPDWRWFLERDDTPWYPSVKLFRQHAHGDWTEVLRDIGVRLLDSIGASDPQKQVHHPASALISCTVCGGDCQLLDVVDFNTSCEDGRGRRFSLSGVPVYYVYCTNCGFSFAPLFLPWKKEEFLERIYNKDYILVDPDYVDKRPRGGAAFLISLFGNNARSIRHLDYGGGSGLMSKLLNESNWLSDSYDPFVDTQKSVAEMGTYDLITAFEVFEHVSALDSLMNNLRSLLAPDGVVLFTTLLSDGNINPAQKLTWWYASPRNGHISLFSKKSLTHLAHSYGFTYLDAGVHIYYTDSLPFWAAHLRGRS